MIKPNLHSMMTAGLVMSLLVPGGAVFGYSYIDLGLMHGNEVEVESNSDIRMDVGTSSTQVDLDVDADFQTDVSLSDTSTTTPEANTSIEAGSSINVTRSQVEQSDEAFINITIEEVNSRETLQAFASSTVSSDDNIEELIFADEFVQITYEQQGRLLTIIPVTFHVTATAYADGGVEVDYPWYKFLMADKRAEVEASIESVVSDVLAQSQGATTTAETSLSTEAALTHEEAATIAARMHSVLRAGYEADAAASSNE